MLKEIHIVVRTDNVKEIKYVFQKVDEAAELVGVDKMQLSMVDKEKKLWWKGGVKEMSERTRNWVGIAIVASITFAISCTITVLSLT